MLGLMTGSSADGLDACLVEFTGGNRQPDFRVLGSYSIDYPHLFQRAFQNPLELSKTEVTKLDHKLGIWLADRIIELGISCDVIASHGQTIRHAPPHFSQQIGNAQHMANRTGVPVIHDFRTPDIKAGGQGAPLIPIVDQYLLQQQHQDVLALNIGGIANLTVLPAANGKQTIIAWDTGPGNTLIDKAVRVYTKNRFNFDPEGSIAKQGYLKLNVLQFLLKHEFYQQPPPRSAGQEQYGSLYFNALLNMFPPQSDQEFKDLIHTLTVLTARTVAASIRSLKSEFTPRELYVAGGGWHNNTLIAMLQAEIPDITLLEFSKPGITTDNKEAFGFAYLGYLRLREFTGNLPGVTGARSAVLLGDIVYPQNS